MRIDLPHGEWAELRDPDRIPRKKAVRFRSSVYKTSAPAAGLSEDELKSTADGRQALGALFEEDGNPLDTIVDSMILAVVTEWSLGDVSTDVIDEMDDATAKALDKHFNEIGYLEYLLPDFEPNPDEDSPTSPS